jgi:hypothetical protein
MGLSTGTVGEMWVKPYRLENSYRFPRTTYTFAIFVVLLPLPFLQSRPRHQPTVPLPPHCVLAFSNCPCSQISIGNCNSPLQFIIPTLEL